MGGWEKRAEIGYVHAGRHEWVGMACYSLSELLGMHVVSENQDQDERRSVRSK